MSIHSMLGSNTTPIDSRRNELQRPNSAHENTIQQQQQRPPNFRASSQPPLPALQSDGRYYTGNKLDHNYGSHHNMFQNSSQQNRYPNGHAHSQPHYHMQNNHHYNHVERDREEERRYARERDAERAEASGTPVMRTELPTKLSSPLLTTHHHHHHHTHRPHVPFKKPRLIVTTQKVFDEAKNYPESKLGHWTYNPTINLPFRLRINSSFTAHIPRRFLDIEQNSALQKRKVWGTEIYTDDSDLAAIVLHTNQSLPEGDIKATFRVMPRLITYKSSMIGDLRSRGWLTKHDGLSLHLEKIEPVAWQEEVKGRGFAKRQMKERLYLQREGLRSVQVDWQPQKYRKLDVEPEDEEEVAVENGGDDTIEIELQHSSFIEPGPLISTYPETLPTIKQES